MQTLEQALVDLVQRGLVTKDEAFARALDRATLEKLMELDGIDILTQL